MNDKNPKNAPDNDDDDPILQSLRTSHSKPNQDQNADPQDDPILRSLRGSKPHIDDAQQTGHGKDFKSGIRVGSISTLNYAEIERKEKASRRQSIIIISVVIAVFALLAAFVYLVPDDLKPASQTHKPHNTANQPSKRQPASTKQHTAPAPAPAPHTPHSTVHTPNSASLPHENTPRPVINNEQLQQANALVDSAKSTQNNTDGSIAFYKMAISFNRHNLQAWQGLYLAYRESGRTQEAAETEREMLEIFGNEIKSVSALVEQFGEITDANKSRDGTYRVEYKTSKRSRDDIMREIYTMARSVRSACNCQNISIHASTGTGGKGMTVYITPQTSVHALSSFERNADILWVE